MTFRGHIANGIVVFDDPVSFPEGTRLAIQVAEARADTAQSAKPVTGAELVAYWQSAGLVGTRPDITDAPAHARALRKQSETRERP